MSAACQRDPQSVDAGGVTVSDRAGRVWAFYQRQKHRVNGTVLVLLGIAAVVWTGVRSSGKTPPSSSELAVLLALGAVLQVAGGASFGRVGRVDPQKALSAVRRLVSTGLAVRDLRAGLAGAQAGATAATQRTLGQVDAALAVISRQLEDAVRDWNDVHPEALKEVLDPPLAPGSKKGRRP
jgi:hypothetical protein